MRAETIRERSPRPPAPGPRAAEAELLLGRYRLGPPRERTATSTVHEGLEEATGRTVTIEIASAVTAPEARSRLLRDAVFAQGLEGEHVLTVWDADSLPDGTPVVVREPSITTLAKEIEARGAFPGEIAAGWTLEVAEAIAEAHALGSAHGDLDPESVVLVRAGDGRLRLAVSWTTARKTLAEVVPDVASDLAGLGRILRALVSGAPTSSAATEEEAAGDDGAKTLPNGVAHVVARALAPAGVKGSGAYAGLAEMVRDLATLAPHAQTSAQAAERLLWQATPTTAAARPHRVGLEDRPDPHAGDPVQPVPWLGPPGAPAKAESERPAHGRTRLLFASLLLTAVAVLFAWALDRALPRVGAGGPSAAPVASPFEGAPETRALADQVTVDGLWSLATALPASSAPAEREREGATRAPPPGTELELEDDADAEPRSPSPLHAPDATAPFELGPIQL